MRTRITLLSTLIIISLVMAGVGASEIHAECTTGLNPYDIETCLGAGEVFLYDTEHPYDDTANATFTPSYDRLLILTRWTTGDDFWLEQDGAVPFVLKDESGDPVYARVYEANVTPGVPVEFTSVRTIDAHQGFISYDSDDGLYNGALESVFEDVHTGVTYLTPGEHSLVYFDKYTEHRSGFLDDRLVTISLDGDEIASFTGPAPEQGAIMTEVDIDSAGSYEIEVDSQDSLYWYTFSCPSGLCEDELYCTQTIGGWGQGASGNNPGTLRDTHWDDVFDENLTIGTGYELIFTGPDAVENYLAGGGPATILSEDHVDPVTVIGGSLGAQLTALQLNIRYAEEGFGLAGSSSYITDHVIATGPFAGWTVGDFRDFVFEVFGGTTPEGDYSLSDIVDTATSINENYVDCTTDNGYLTPYCGSEPYCGDGEVNQESEQCDGSAPEGFTCTDSCELEANDPVCELDSDEYETVVDIDARLRSDKSESRARSDRIPVSLLPGTYEVTLQAHDAYYGRQDVSQPNESYVVRFLDDWTPVVTSAANEDLEDNVMLAETIELVNTDLYIGTAIDHLEAYHPAYPSENPNSLNAVCVGLNRTAYCGDGLLNQDVEECDGDAGVGEHQSCTDTCELENLTYCGDGIVQQPNDEGTGGPGNDGYESCDGDAGVGENEECSAQCTIIDLPYCGDGVVNQPSEQCDGTDGVGEHQSCNAFCELENLTYCGDGIKQTPNDEGTGGPENDGYEACDGTDGIGPNQECTSSCTIENLTYCGDGIVQQPNEVGTGGPEDDGYEECDGSAPEGFSCSASCELIEDSCPLPGVNHSYTGPVHENMSVYIDTVSRIVIELEENVTSECVDETLVEYAVTYVADEYCQSAQLCSDLDHEVDWSEYEGPFGFDAEGCYVVDYRASDADENETGRACVFHDETPPTLNKMVGEPNEWWDGSNVYYPEAEDWCWSTEEGPECYTLTMGTPIEMSCSESGAEQSGAAKLCFEVGLDGDDATQQYCETADGTMENGACCVMSEEYTLYFEEESWHKLSFSCTDHVNKTSEKDVEYFKVEEGSFEIELNKKWNLISVPFELFDSAPESVFEGLDVAAVWSYKNGEWLIWSPDAPSNLDSIEPGRGYWVLMRESGTLLFGGSEYSEAKTPPGIDIVYGWNLVGYYGTEGLDTYEGPFGAGRTASCALSSIRSSAFDTVFSSLVTYWEPGNPEQWVLLGGDDRMDPGAGYWLFATKDGSYARSTSC